MSVSMLVSCAEKEQEQEFWLGADLGWITEYEAWQAFPPVQQQFENV